MKITLPRAALVGLGLAWLAGCGGHAGRKPRMAEIERLPRLETARPEVLANLAVRRTYTATVEPFEKVDLCAQVRGVVQPIAPHIDIGQSVKAGAVLLTLDIPDARAERNSKKALLDQAKNQQSLADQAIRVAVAEEKEAEAQVTRYQNEAEFRKLQAARVQKLAQTDTVTAQLAEETQLQYQAALAALGAAKAQVNTKQARLQSAHAERKVAESRIQVAQADLERQEALVNFASVRAPFDGIITKRWVDTGASVKDSNMPLLTLVRSGKVRVLLDIPERDMPYLAVDQATRRGNRVTLDIPALRDVLGNQLFEGVVTLTAAALDPVTRTMRTEIHFDQAHDAKVVYLKPQMTGSATVVLSERKAITVPASALVRSGSKLELYYIADPSGDPPRGVVKKIEVQIGLDDGKRVEIRSNNLTGRELVIVRGAGVIRGGDLAIPVAARDQEGS